MTNKITCTTCGKTKGVAQYHKNPKGKYGRANQCKLCRNAYDRSKYIPSPRTKKPPVEKTRYCSICETYKAKRHFKRAGKWCNDCKENKSEQYLKDYQHNWHLKRGLEVKEFIFKYLSLHKCIDCGQTNILVLEFDHKDPKQKSFDLGRAHMKKDLTIKELVKEIAKCVVRCGNCHKIKTQQEQNTWRWQKVNAQTSKEVSDLL